MDKREIIYYTDEINDEFSLAKIAPRKIDGSYVYCHDSLFKKFTRFFWYRIVAMPIAFLYCKIKFHFRAVNAKVLKKAKKSGCFLYGNHTQDIGDAFLPNLLNASKSKYFIVHPKNVSMKVLGKITPSLGALPLPDDRAAYANFLKAIERRISEKKAIVIYPEAHIWPYYTGIRPFPDTSFHYPVKLGVPAFLFVNTYQKRKFSAKPKTVTYVDGPFYPDEKLPPVERKKDLRDRVYKRMCELAKNSTVERIKYIKKDG